MLLKDKETLTRRHDHTPPKSGQIRPGGVAPRWMSLGSDTQNCP